MHLQRMDGEDMELVFGSKKTKKRGGCGRSWRGVVVDPVGEYFSNPSLYVRGRSYISFSFVIS
ncbi:hypothetical protein BGX38DRAFT_1175268 [Terfezia claveryi]|nr:hypothetical protein BGX38DRAFT_1175268 [Terfezia claveryi]